ncbi:serine/threonine-protein kinase [Stieleria varia]|uniref:Serine/threonine-protein kinase PrkC n=1 Tax=Stieleria varia TaxID=2528005 RepID=A0A5C6A3Q5_9BACT|nr:serine/threonine-protein kinase [Stieleria varia]TWT94005.1 Serine/threonine-protein kinase PrkC [Stieleria varia]
MPSNTTNQPRESNAKLRCGSKLGKYRLDRRIGSGGFASVYAATDTVLGIKVALKIPMEHLVSQDLLDEFRREARMTVKLEHPNILPIRDATFIDGHFVIVAPLGETTLDERLKKRLGFDRAIDIFEQLLSGVAHAHQQGIIHCDIKPENVLLFKDGAVRLADFGIAKAASTTITGSGTGTIGYMAPEQAMGKPSARSDVFSLGLIAYRLFSGCWPEYPFDWPMGGYSRLRRTAHPDLIAVIRKSLVINARGRFKDAAQMLSEFEKVRLKAIRYAKRNRG